MALLMTLQGPDVGRKYPLAGDATVLGRQYDSHICLTGKAISRQHAQIVCRQSSYFVEDLDSSNGTFLNGLRLAAHTLAPISDRDMLQIGPYVFGLRVQDGAAAATPNESNLVVREKVSATLGSSVYGQDPSHKLQVV